MADTATLPGLTKGNGKQLSNKELQDKIRSHIPKAIEALVGLLESKNENARVGAIKILLAKILPDLKSESITDEEGNTYKLLLDVPGIRLVKDARDSVQPVSKLPAETTTGS